MNIDNYQLVIVFIVLIILGSIQYSLNQLLMHSKEIIHLLHLIVNKTKS